MSLVWNQKVQETHIFNASEYIGAAFWKIYLVDGDKENVVNYRSVSVLPCFSKIIERIIFKRLYLYFTEKNLLYNKQFGFQKEYSPDHAIVQLEDHIHEMFNKNIHTLSVFIDLPKGFDTVNQKIPLKKLSHYGIKNKTLDWFTCYIFLIESSL